MKLVLWDIDGTLVDTAGHGARAFGDAFEVVFGRPPEALVPMAGKTDHEIALGILERNEVEGGEDHLPRMWRELEAALVPKAGRHPHRGPGAAGRPGRARGAQRARRRPPVAAHRQHRGQRGHQARRLRPGAVAGARHRRLRLRRRRALGAGGGGARPRRGQARPGPDRGRRRAGGRHPARRGRRPRGGRPRGGGGQRLLERGGPGASPARTRC